PIQLERCSIICDHWFGYPFRALSNYCNATRICNVLSFTRGGLATLYTVTPDIAWDLRTTNVDLVRSEISRLLRPFKLTADPRRTYDARLFGRQFSRTGIAIIDYGHEVDVEADPMQSFSLIQIPIRGSFELHGMGRSA